MKKDNIFEIKENLEQNSHKYDFYEFNNAKHMDGFSIFIDEKKTCLFDEYKNTDPYSVEKNLQSDFHQRRLNSTLELIERVVDSTSTFRLLDLGCGQGHFTKKIKEKFVNAEISGADYSLSAIEFASNNSKEIDYIVADAYCLPYVDEYFDVIVCNNIWEHVADPLCLLRQISKKMKRGGHIIVSTPSRFRLGNIVRLMSGKDVVFMSNNHVTEYTIGQVYEQLAYGGFVNINHISPAIESDSNLDKVELKIKIAVLFLRHFLKKRGIEESLNSTVFYSAQKS